MSYDVEKIQELYAETVRLAALATAITDKPVLSVEDRRQFDIYVSLIEEINDYAARLQRPGEKWKIDA